MEIVHYPSQILEQVCEEVTVFDDDLRDVAQEMAVTMYSSRGVGLAAPQVGLNKRIITIDPTAGSARDGLIALVNPKVTWQSKEIVSLLEGCLSLPGTIVTVERSECIETSYQTVEGVSMTASFTGWAARIILHEIDHLDGVMMIDRLNKTERDVLLKCYTSRKSRESKRRKA